MSKSKTYARTLFLSDIHLGYKPTRVRELLDFLHGIDAERIVLVGDIVDGLSLAKRFFWSDEHTQVLRWMLARRRAGSRLIYLPGNHDHSFGTFADLLQGQLEVHREFVHRTARGERLLVVHGDQFDGHMTCPKWLESIGDGLYSFFVGVNGALNKVRRGLGKGYWSLPEYLKLRTPRALRYINQFEHTAVSHARTSGYDGIICGHIHRAKLCRVDGTLYANTGDWVESCSALVEDRSGELQLWRWPHCAVTPMRLASPLVPLLLSESGASEPRRSR
jgi:UDP-2,3-diacylglucosamine pyrophosphatase LpxH